MAKDAFYFSHDTNASQDEKLVKVMRIHGLEGIGLYWIMIELLHQQESGTMDKESFESILAMYVNSFGVNKQHLLNCCSTFVEHGLFKLINNSYTNDRVLRNIEHRKEVSDMRKLAGKASAYKRSNLLKSQSDSNKCSTVVQQMFNNKKERKGKEKNILDRSIESNSSKEVKQCIDAFFQKHQQKLGSKYHVDGGKDGNIIKSLLNTFSKDELISKIDLFFDNPNDFTKQAGFTIGVFKSQINKLTAGKSNELLQLEKLMSEKNNASN